MPACIRNTFGLSILRLLQGSSIGTLLLFFSLPPGISRKGVDLKGVISNSKRSARHHMEQIWWLKSTELFLLNCPGMDDVKEEEEET